VKTMLVKTWQVMILITFKVKIGIMELGNDAYFLKLMELYIPT
jgi:hypothetical protein